MDKVGGGGRERMWRGVDIFHDKLKLPKPDKTFEYIFRASD
jgi:hypothetical protein